MSHSAARSRPRRTRSALVLAGVGALVTTTALGVPTSGSADTGGTLLPHGQFDVTAMAAAIAPPTPANIRILNMHVPLETELPLYWPLIEKQ